MTTLSLLIETGAQQFSDAGLYFGHGTDNPWDEAALLASHALGLSFTAFETELSNELNEEQASAIRTIFQQRIRTRQPAAYLTGKAYFAGLEFVVTSDVLVPRSPVAELIDKAFMPWIAGDPKRILDLCTGCGCIGIATAMQFPNAEVDLSDVSAAALAVAERNITHHVLQGRVRVVESDGFDKLRDQRYDLILCNPPYVDAEDFASMPEEYRAEPELALASGDDGLDFTRVLLAQASQHLTDTGSLIVEVGNSWVHLERAYPDVPFLWLDFEHGGHGVFVMNAAEINQYQQQFDQGLAKD